MHLALLSDTHNNAQQMTWAMQSLHQRGPGFVIHCGDIGTASMLDLFRVEPGRYAAGFVFGNDDENQGNCAALRSRALELGVVCFERFGEFEMGGKRFAVLHGDDEQKLAATIATGEYDIVLHGHTHVWRDQQSIAANGKTVRVINPGALDKPRPNEVGTIERTCAIMDVEQGKLLKIYL